MHSGGGCVTKDKEQSRPKKGGQSQSASGGTTSGKRTERKQVSVRVRKEHHQVAKSMTDNAVAEARGYEYVDDARRLKALGFDSYQWKIPGLLIPIYSTDPAEREPVLYQFRPRKPRTKKELIAKDHVVGKPIKYETPGGSRMRIDCPPHALAHLKDASAPLFITEGVKKADAAVGMGLCCVALMGVWNWKGTRRDGTSGPLEDWDHIALDGRTVYVAYDSDLMHKEDVGKALQELTAFLVRRHATVKWILLPDGGPDLGTGKPEKVGLDDYLAGGRSVEELLALAVPPRVWVTVNRQLHKKTVMAATALELSNQPPYLFQRADVLVAANRRGVEEVSKDRLRYLLAKNTKWVREKKGEYTPTDPDVQTVANLMVSVEEWPFPVLDRLVFSPVFAQDGTLRTERGYHASSKTLYLPPEGLVIPAVPEMPSAKQISKARSLFMDKLFGQFPFVDEADAAHALALALQPFARDLIRGNTPMYGVEAPKQGTGKTLLVEAALAASIGDVPSHSEPHKDEELEKRITATMATAEPLFFLDNMVRRVDYPSLATALTKSTWQGRILGESRGLTAPIKLTWVMTGNNPTYADDIARRIVPIRLDAQAETPHQRDGFKLSLPEWALQHRNELVYAACVLVQAWVAAGRPAPDASVPTLGKFGPYRRVMGGVLEVAGVPGFLRNLNHLTESSPEAEAFRMLASLVVATYGRNKPFDAASVYDLVKDEVEIASAIDPTHGANPHGFKTKLGSFLSSHKDQIVGELKLQKLPRGKGGARYVFTSTRKGK